jgi:NADH-quinone oxidoreductase subunit E
MTAEAAGGVHPGVDHDEPVADWSPHAHRDGNPFDELFARLRPELEGLIAQYEDSRSALLPIVHRFQEEEGWTSPNALVATASLLRLPLAVVESTVSFYTLFFRRPVGKYMLQVCRNLSCSINGAEEIMTYFRRRLGVDHLETTEDGLFSYEEVECLAACDRAPCMQVNLEFVFDLTPQVVDDMIAAIRGGAYGIAPLRQTRKPGRTWHVEQDTGLKSPGGRDVVDANNAGGVGDRTGIVMLDRLVNDAALVERTRERLAHEKTFMPKPSENHH